MSMKNAVKQRFPRATCEQLPDTMWAIWPNDGSDIRGCIGVGNSKTEAWKNAAYHVLPKSAAPATAAAMEAK